MTPAALIALKDLRLRVRDRSLFIWGVIAPLGLAAIFSLLLGDIADPDSISVTVGVTDLDRGPTARVLVDDVLGRLDDEGIITLEEVGDRGALDASVEDGGFDAGIVIPTGFSEAVESGSPASLEVVGSLESPIGAQAARAITEGFAGEINAVGLSVATEVMLTGGHGDASAITDAARQHPSPLALADLAASDKELSPETFYSAAMAVFFLFFTVQFGVIGLLEERQEGTMARLLVAPIRRNSIILGKAATSFVLGVLSMTILVAGTTLLLGAEWGSPIGVAILVLAGVLAAVGLMAVVATFARTAESAANLQSILAVILGMLGGAFFPVAQAGELLRVLSLATPHAWFLRGLGELSAGGGVASVLPAAGAIALFGVVTLALSRIRVGQVLSP